MAMILTEPDSSQVNLDDYYYHITKRVNFTSIKTAGLRPQINYQGATWSSYEAEKENQEKLYILGRISEINKALEIDPIKLTGILGEGLFAEFEEIESHTPENIIRLGEIAKEFLVKYMSTIPVEFKKKHPALSFSQIKITYTPLANQIHGMGNTHFLYKLSKWVKLQSTLVELNVSSGHVYFFGGKHIAIQYPMYVGFLKVSYTDVIILRVHKSHVSGLVNDEAQGNALMTKNPITPDHIECFTDFPDSIPTCITLLSDPTKATKILETSI